MKRLSLVLGLFLISCTLFAHSNQQGSQTSGSVPEEKQSHESTSPVDASKVSQLEAAAAAASLSAQPKQSVGNVDVLSDTKGVDFGPYLARVIHDVKMNWYNLIPAVARPPVMKMGKVSIEFAITKKGQIAQMRLVGPSGDVSLDRAAWGGITGSNPFPPLPPEYSEQYLALRFHFYYNPNRAPQQGAISINELGEQVRKSTKSAIPGKVSPALIQLAQGESQRFLVKAKDKKATVVWRVSGLDCSGSDCGIISDGLYTAPPNVFVPIHVGVVAEVTDHKGRTGRDIAMVTIVHHSVENRSSN